MNRVITISRQYGSGGRELGEKLAARLGIPFYDKELVGMIAREGKIETAVLEAYDEVALCIAWRQHRLHPQNQSYHVRRQVDIWSTIPVPC